MDWTRLDELEQQVARLDKRAIDQRARTELLEKRTAMLELRLLEMVGDHK